MEILTHTGTVFAWFCRVIQSHNQWGSVHHRTQRRKYCPKCGQNTGNTIIVGQHNKHKPHPVGREKEAFKFPVTWRLSWDDFSFQLTVEPVLFNINSPIVMGFILAWASSKKGRNMRNGSTIAWRRVGSAGKSRLLGITIKSA